MLPPPGKVLQSITAANRGGEAQTASCLCATRRSLQLVKGRSVLLVLRDMLSAHKHAMHNDAGLDQYVFISVAGCVNLEEHAPSGLKLCQTPSSSPVLNAVRFATT